MKKIKSLLIYLLIIVFFTGCAATVKPDNKVNNDKKVTSQVTLSVDENTDNGDASQKVAATTNPPVVPSIAKPVTTQTSSVQVATTPVIPASGGRVICIDPGHGTIRPNPNLEQLAPGSKTWVMSDGGGAGNVANSAWDEYKVNWSVALKLQQLLKIMGYTVVMTKSNIAEDPTNIRRADIATLAGAALEIRIHADSNSDSNMTGASMQLPNAINANTTAIYDKSWSYGKTILDTLASKVGMANNGTKGRSDLIGFNWAQVPTILVEMGFLSNKVEAARLANDGYQNQLAQAIADGIAKAVPVN